MQAAKLAPMHMVDWGKAQEADVVLAACRKWLQTCKDTLPQKRDALLKKYMGSQADMEEGHAFFHMHNSLVLSKGLLYISTTPKGEVKGVLAFLVPVGQHTAALVFTAMQATRESRGRWPWHRNDFGGLCWLMTVEPWCGVAVPHL